MLDFPVLYKKKPTLFSKTLKNPCFLLTTKKNATFLVKTDDVRMIVKKTRLFSKNFELHSKRGLIISLIDLRIDI